MIVKKDSHDQPYIEWAQGENGFKRAWIQCRKGTDRDWAESLDGKYLNVVRIEALGRGPAGNATDFPIFSTLPHEQILIAFVVAVSGITGCPIEPDAP